MSTRAAVATVNEDRTVTSIRVYRDAYPEHLGATLENNYGTSAKIRELMSGGDIMDIAASVGKTSYCCPDKRQDWEMCKVKVYRNLKAFKEENFGSWDYLYIYRSGKWECFDCNE